MDDATSKTTNSSFFLLIDVPLFFCCYCQNLRGHAWRLDSVSHLVRLRICSDRYKSSIQPCIQSQDRSPAGNISSTRPAGRSVGLIFSFCGDHRLQGSQAFYDAHFETNFKRPVFLAKAAAPLRPARSALHSRGTVACRFALTIYPFSGRTPRHHSFLQQQ
ncbi:hypothetical protein B0H12DRAFT_214797 [Mycena haematopus]|nr:hypothetical protein B0H12DRAFT_214797 [Mycena haematopus]